jgi:hypothetical protein
MHCQPHIYHLMIFLRGPGGVVFDLLPNDQLTDSIPFAPVLFTLRFSFPALIFFMYFRMGSSPQFPEGTAWTLVANNVR